MANKEPYAKELNKQLSKIDFQMLRDETYKGRELMTYYHCAMLEMETKFNVLNEQFALQNERNPIDSIKTRLKTVQSIKDKLQRNGYEFTVENIENHLNDVAGVRIICSFVDDIYLLADCLTEQDDIKIIEIKDYIKNPKPSGYRSFHLVLNVPVHLSSSKTTVPVEIQIRTIAMDFWASLEHQLRYKPSGTITPEISEELRLCAERIAETYIQMQKLYTEIME